MGKNKSIFDTMKGLFSQSKDNPTGKKKNKNQYLLLVLAIGVAFMLLSNLFSNNEETPKVLPASAGESNNEEPAFGQKKDIQAQAISAYEDSYENALKEVLEAIVGVDDVIAYVSVDATETKILEKNIVSHSQSTDEVDRDGGKRKVEDVTKDEQVVTIRSGDSETPIILKIEKPEIRSVAIVAKGADNIKIKQMIIEAVNKGFDVPIHKISVSPRKIKGDS
ncbi:stage III sporulation protein AG [Ferdinandcohnia quinoae]|uniref:Stage III sporulation protein AG n=1 Tax=Fredinandcohnia quinoae TaxID=2918902 RepID=A0AAW5E9D2_9BACI|nr:stage III sporulation protein AG [Fredinandcohnia sp. SECRCQ15]MCH1626622.1 stage III sporulation protein AG [Fredinandcohnia sp. SECRCQ15]